MSDIDTAVVVDGLKALDPKWPIREADIAARQRRAMSRSRPKSVLRPFRPREPTKNGHLRHGSDVPIESRSGLRNEFLVVAQNIIFCDVGGMARLSTFPIRTCEHGRASASSLNANPRSKCGGCGRSLPSRARPLTLPRRSQTIQSFW